MLRIGEWNHLQMVKKREFGMYLAERGSAGEEVLLPKRQVPDGADVGTEIDVFLYRDSADRMIATTNRPLLTMGELAVLTCVNTTSIGAFMDWGLEKDILLPFKEQTAKVVEGRSYLVRMYADRSNRLCVSMKVYPYLETPSPYKVGDTVKGTVYELNKNLGAFVAVDNRYSALIPMKEIHSKMLVGDSLEARVASIREDGKLNLTLQKEIRAQIEQDSQMIYGVIESYGGVLPFNDKADKEVIEREFGLSKNAFKRAVGHLMKEGKIRIDERTIVIVE